MPIYISLLRGINVSGQKKIIMTDLKKLYTDLGFVDVITYIQSGNVIFKTEINRKDLAELITNKIKEVYNFEVPVLVLTPDELVSAKANNPYLKKDLPIERLAIVFLDEVASQERINTIESDKYLPDEFIVDGKFLFLHAAGGFGKSKLSNNFFESKLKVAATSRNIKTVNKLIELSE